MIWKKTKTKDFPSILNKNHDANYGILFLGKSTVCFECGSVVDIYYQDKHTQWHSDQTVSNTLTPSKE